MVRPLVFDLQDNDEERIQGEENSEEREED